MRKPNENEDLLGKVCVCRHGLAGIVCHKSVTGKNNDITWHGISLSKHKRWQSKDPTIIAEDIYEYHSLLEKQS